MKRDRILFLTGVLFIPAFLFAVPSKKTSPAGKPATVAEAKAFLDEAETKLLALATDAGRAAWVQSTHITDDTEILAAQANERSIAATVAYAKNCLLYTSEAAD